MIIHFESHVQTRETFLMESLGRPSKIDLK